MNKPPWLLQYLQRLNVFSSSAKAACVERVGFINRTGCVDLFVNKPHLGTSIQIKGNGGVTSRVGFRQVGFINPT